jgi:subtilase family serine protease
VLAQYGAPGAYAALESYGHIQTAASITGDWELEQSLDVEWAHAVAPAANIVLVQTQSAYSNYYTQRFQAIRTAAAQASVVSMSWGIPNTASYVSAYEGDITAAAGEEGVTLIAASGDYGSSRLQFPATSSEVLAVGGTSFTIDGDGNYGSETGWPGSTGGVSSLSSQTRPSYQVVGSGSAFLPQSQNQRTVPDVSWLADPSTGVAVYDSFRSNPASEFFATTGFWQEVGGTSLAAPMWAGLVAITDQGRVADGLSTLNGATQTLPMLYQLSSSDFHDITTGNNGGYSAGPGYDLVTGLGSPNVLPLVSDMVGMAPNVLYVDPSASGSTHNGSTWTDAYASLPAALSYVGANSSTAYSIFVSGGTYTSGNTRERRLKSGAGGGAGGRLKNVAPMTLPHDAQSGWRPQAANLLGFHEETGCIRTWSNGMRFDIGF